MPHYHAEPRQLRNYPLNQLITDRRLFLAAAVVLALVTLACGLVSSKTSTGSGQVVFLTRLPTLTRTPLPPLTFATTDTPAATAMPTEPVEPALAAAPEPIKPEAESPMVAPEAATISTPIEPAAETAPLTVEAVSLSAVPPGQNATGPGAGAGSSPGPSTEVGSTTPGLSSAPESALSAVLPSVTAPPPPTATPTATAAPSPTSTPTAAPTPTPLPEGWVFSGVGAQPAANQTIVSVFGEVINNTGTAQQLTNITGNFYNAQDQLIPPISTIHQSPIRTIPQGGRVPFKLFVPGLQNRDDFDLAVEAIPVSSGPRQDFEFADVNGSTDGDSYCITAKVRNAGDPLESHLQVVAVLYDGLGQVINFEQLPQMSATDLVAGQPLEVNICVDRGGQEVTRHDLRSWGL